MALFPMKNVYFKRAFGPKDSIPFFKGPKGIAMPEIALIGRSNVGKSSLINHFFHHKGLAKTSSTPGKTQTVNVFVVDDALVFVDLPGYGFAKVQKEIRREWGPLIEGYLNQRSTLLLVLFLFDIRRTPTSEDISMVRWLTHRGKNVILVMTKSDKIPKASRRQCALDILKKLDIDAPFVLYSTKEGTCKEVLKSLIIDRLHPKNLIS